MYLLLMILWLILNGRITPELLLLGAVLTAALGLVIRALFGYGPARELRLYRKTPLFLAFAAVLAWQIVKANFSVARIVLGPDRLRDPVLIRVRVDLKTDLARFLLANAITLTPGTITVRSRGDTLTVHCLNGALLEDLKDGILIRLLRKMEA